MLATSCPRSFHKYKGVQVLHKCSPVHRWIATFPSHNADRTINANMCGASSLYPTLIVASYKNTKNQKHKRLLVCYFAQLGLFGNNIIVNIFKYLQIIK